MNTTPVLTCRRLYCASIVGLLASLAACGSTTPHGGGGTTNTGGNGSTVTAVPSDGGVVNSHCLLVPTNTGALPDGSNDVGAYGTVYTFQDTGGSTIVPLTSATVPFTNAGDGKLCVSGTGAKVLTDPGATTPNYTKYYGAAMAIDLWASADGKTKKTLGEAGSKLVGLRFNVTATTMPHELRAEIHEAGRDESAYIDLTTGSNTVTFSEATVAYSTKAPAVDPTKMDGIQFMIPTVELAATPFDFCIDHIEFLTSGGSCDNGDTGGGTDGGVTPTGVTAADALAAYGPLKDLVKACGSNGSYVANGSGTEGVSEGIGYGMLAAVANNDQATFDALWKFYKATPDGTGSGLMNWKTTCNGGSIQVTGANSATDADEDVAMALLQASCTFTGGSYAADAKLQIGRVKGEVGKPGDAWNGSCQNPSYQAPGYYRAFAAFTGDSSWTGIADAAYTNVLNSSANASTGLIPNWISACDNSVGNYYGYESYRAPWRLATDYQWYKSAAAGAILTKEFNFIKGKGGLSYLTTDILNMDGSLATTGGGITVYGSNAAIVGSLAVTSIMSDQATQDAYYHALKAKPATDYYTTALKALYLAFGAKLLKTCP